jgi:hypothetical protein
MPTQEQIDAVKALCGKQASAQAIDWSKLSQLILAILPILLQFLGGGTKEE